MTMACIFVLPYWFCYIRIAQCCLRKHSVYHLYLCWTNIRVTGVHHTVQPGHSQFYTWDNPNHVESLKWTLLATKKT